jgi:hypothetical protein
MWQMIKGKDGVPEQQTLKTILDIYGDKLPETDQLREQTEPQRLLKDMLDAHDRERREIARAFLRRFCIRMSSSILHASISLMSTPTPSRPLHSGYHGTRRDLHNIFVRRRATPGLRYFRGSRPSLEYPRSVSRTRSKSLPSPARRHGRSFPEWPRACRLLFQ